MKFLSTVSAVFVGAAILAQPTLAASTAAAPAASSSSSSQSSLFETLTKNMRAQYAFEATGANTKALSGNSAGGGTSLTFAHYAILGRKLGSKWSVSATQPFVQRVDENPNNDPFYAADPYVTFSNSRILGSDAYSANLSGALRYSAPISNATRWNTNLANANDQGYGRLRLMLAPSKSFMDGALEFSAPTYLYYRIAKRTDAERTAATGSKARNDLDFLPTAAVAYQLTKNVQPYLELAALVHHTTSGTNKKAKWTKFNDPSDGLSVRPGANINVGKKLLLNPVLDFGPQYRGLKNGEIEFTAVYSFL